jgi:hypothetical protein
MSNAGKTSTGRCSPPLQITHVNILHWRSMYHVHGHMDDLLQHNQLSVEQIVYCHMDKLASEALMNGVSSERFITR